MGGGCLRGAGALGGGRARVEEVFGGEVGGVVLGPIFMFFNDSCKLFLLCLGR